MSIQVFSSGHPGDFSFFAGSEALYGETTEIRQPLRVRRTVVSLESGRVEERQESYVPDSTRPYHAISDRVLIGLSRAGGLVKVRWPDFTELLRLPVEEAGAVLVSADKQRFIFLDGKFLVCRRSEDFSLLWNVRLIHASTSGSTGMITSIVLVWRPLPTRFPLMAEVALAPSSAAYDDQPERFYFELLDGDKGTPIVRLALRHFDRIALSKDGRLLAIGQVTNDQSGGLKSIVQIYALPSGQEVATITHDQVSLRRRLLASISGIDFTADGRYLVTSANDNVKVWQLADF